MKKSDPKLIININLDNPDLQEKVKLAVDEYIEDTLNSHYDEAITQAVGKAIDKRLRELFEERRYTYAGQIEGEYLSDYIYKHIKTKVDEKVKAAIVSAVNDKFSELFKQ